MLTNIIKRIPQLLLSIYKLNTNFTVYTYCKTKMKIVYRGETRMVPDDKGYDELVLHLSKIFAIGTMDEVGESLKLFYMDLDGDIISVTSQDDLKECNMRLNNRFALCASVDEARDALSVARNAATGALNRSEALNQSFASIQDGSLSARGYGQLGAVGQGSQAEFENLL